METGEQKQLMMKDLPQDERPREKLMKRGSEALSNAELLAILLRTGTKEESALRLAERILVETGEEGLYGLAHSSIKSLMKRKGVGSTKAITIAAALELGKRVAMGDSQKRVIIRSSDDIANYMMPRLRYFDKEYFYVVLLNTKNHVIAAPMISVGTLSESLVHPRELFKEAVNHSASAVILVHNHPSGDPSPSKEDIMMTKRIIEGGKLLDIKVLDHVIIGDNTYISLREQGYFER
ncbi:MAG: DNA repair protein RadC [Selenomonadales bacterium]|nr:DNA repair protein RadC [Selenomonadales bacterium]